MLLLVHRKSSPKKTCRITITNFLLSFSIYLVSSSLYAKLAYRILLKRHLIFVANINHMFFWSLLNSVGGVASVGSVDAWVE